jgi:cellulose synthase (UDP-forming)
MAGRDRRLSDSFQKGLILPDPPRRDEQFQYLGKQHLRVLALALFIFSMGSVYGIYAVFSQAPAWYPFLLMLLVLVPWVLYVVVLSTFRPRVTWESHEMVTTAGAYMLKHSVDIFIPVCGEDPRIIENTFRHVCQLSWPGELSFYCLDDADSPDARQLAEKYGLTYLVRDDRPLHKKSGNLNNGLRNSTGEFIVVFDADFAPAPEFLLETLPYMLYTNLGIVQTAQYFDVKRSNTKNWVQQMSGSVQDMFFCWAQPARNTADAAMCVGTNAVYRRNALESIGGFPRVSAGGEDVVTGLDMYAKGWRTIYLPLALAKGVCPDHFDAVINQQYRWSGTCMRMFTGDNEYSRSFKGARLKLSQKLVFWSGLLYYAQSMLALVVTVLPSIAMLWAFPGKVGPGNYIPIAPAMLGMFMLPFIIRGWRPSLLRMIVVYSTAHILSAVDTIKENFTRQPTDDKHWIPSGVKRQSSRTRLAGLIVRTWFVVTQTAIWAAIIRDFPVYGIAHLWPAIVLSIFQTTVLLPLMFPGYGIVAQATLLPHLTREGFRRWRVKRFYGKYLSQQEQ